MSELMMAQMPFPPQPQHPVSHVVPGIGVSQHGMHVETTDDLTVVIESDKGSVELTQQQFIALLGWQQHLIHQDWE
jgi:hypothetical protein